MINGWAFLFFFDAANCELLCNSLSENRIIMMNTVVMILRVWVMYNRSRLILGILLMLFSVEVISTIIAAVVGSDPKNLSGM